MASIKNVKLAIREAQGRADLTVTYDLIGDAQDVQDRPIYLEYVDLIGDDKEPGEDGFNEFLTDGELFTGLMRFGPAEPTFHRERNLQVASSLLDEDRATGPFSGFPIEDEIRARVKLTPLTFSATGTSGIVRRGGLPGNKVDPVQA